MDTAVTLRACSPPVGTGGRRYSEGSVGYGAAEEALSEADSGSQGSQGSQADFWQQLQQFSDDIADRYTFEYRPEYRAKVRKQFERLTLGMNYEVNMGRLEFTIKPGRKGREGGKKPWWQQILITPADRDVRFYSNRVDVGPLCLQMVLGHDFQINRTGVRWRLSMPWDSQFKKQQWKMKRGPLDVGFNWDLLQTAPHLEGQYGIGTDTDPFDVDIGKVHFSVPRVQAALRF